MALYLHPDTSIIDAAIYAFRFGCCIEAVGTRLVVRRGSNFEQFKKALQCKELQQFITDLRTDKTGRTINTPNNPGYRGKDATK